MPPTLVPMKRGKGISPFPVQSEGGIMIAAPKRSLRRLCFYRCLSVHRGEGTCLVGGGGGCVIAGGHAWLLGGMHGCWGGMHGCQGHAWLLGGMHGCRGHAWLLGGMCGCQGMCSCWEACVVARGHAWLLGVCMVAGGMHARGVGVVAGEVCMVAEGGHA